MFEDKNQETGNQKSLQKHQWVNGIWYNYDNKMTFWEIEGDKISMKSHYHFDHPDMKCTTGKISYGDFDEAKDEIYRATGYKNYNVLIEIDFEGFEFKLNAVITKAKTKMYTWGFTNKMEIINWVKKEELEKIKNIRDPYEAPKNPYWSDSKGSVITVNNTPSFPLFMLSSASAVVVPYPHSWWKVIHLLCLSLKLLSTGPREIYCYDLFK